MISVSFGVSKSLYVEGRPLETIDKKFTFRISTIDLPKRDKPHSIILLIACRRRTVGP